MRKHRSASSLHNDAVEQLHRGLPTAQINKASFIHQQEHATHDLARSQYATHSPARGSVFTQNTGNTEVEARGGLGAEDKVRIAQLIVELARIGQQRDAAVKALNAEREAFSRKVLDLSAKIGRGALLLRLFIVVELMNSIDFINS